MTYSETVLDHFYAPRGAFRMEAPDRTGRSGAPYLVLYLRLDGDRIREASFQTYGRAPAIAAGSVVCERVPGMTLAEARAVDATRILEWLGGLPEAKRFCAEMVAEALREAVG